MPPVAVVMNLNATGGTNVTQWSAATGGINYASGNVGIGTTTPTADLHLKAGTATAGTAPLKFTSGTNLTTPEAGAVEYDGTSLYFTDGSANRHALATTNATTSFSSPITMSGAGTGLAVT